MNYVDRILLVVIALTFLVSSILLLFVTLGWNPASSVSVLIDSWSANPPASLVIVSFLLLLAAIYLFLSGIRRTAPEPALLEDTEFGKVRISLRAVDSLVQRAAREVKGISHVESKVIPGSNGISIHLTVETVPDTSIPGLASEVQGRLMDYIRQTVGIAPSSVSVEVRGISKEFRPKVE